MQFQPADTSDCDNSKAGWRIFFENETEAHGEDKWNPEDEQWCTPPSSPSRRLRRRQACGLDDPLPDITEADITEPDVSWETPAGSSCAATATAVQCNMGACVPTSSCESWVATTTEEPAPPPPTDLPKPPPKQPFTENEVVCHDKDDFSGHADISEWEQYSGALGFCASEHIPESMDPSSVDTQLYAGRLTDYHGINYDWMIYWEPECMTEQEMQNPLLPLGDDGPNCHDIMINNYFGCEYILT